MLNLELVFPEIFLSLSIMFLLILGVFKKNSTKLVQNISKVSHFYENDFTNHLENSNLQDIEKFYIKKQLKSIVSYANEKFKRDLFIEKCQDCFRIAS